MDAVRAPVPARCPACGAILPATGIGCESCGWMGEPLPGDDERAPAIIDPLTRFLDAEIPLPSAARDEADSLRDALRTCRGEGGDEPDVAAQVEQLGHWCESAFDRRYDRPEMRAGDLHQLQVSAAGYTSRSRFLTELTLEPPASTGGAVRSIGSRAGAYRTSSFA